MSARSNVYVPAPDETPPPVSEIGGKGHHLTRLLGIAAAGPQRHAIRRFRVPPFIVVTAAAFDRCVLTGRPWPDSEADAEQRRLVVAQLEIPPALRGEIVEALHTTHMYGAPIAVRSSAAEEDGSNASFAGQFETVLGVSAVDDTPLWSALRSVWASAFLAHAGVYRASRGRGGSVRMAVVLQQLVDPETSGVAFSADPVTRDLETSVVSAVYGLGEGLVSGELDADTYRVRFGTASPPEVSVTVASKDRAVRSRSSGGTILEEVPAARRNQATLSDDEARHIATCARSLAHSFDGPQDVEWALVGEVRELVVLQTRPITSLTGARHVWDNSNIIESYSGVTTPLTFTFARRVYEDVYRQFLRLMGVDERLVAEHDEVLANLLALVRGRVYYNLLNWYRTLALLPGFTFNRGFMERMMGVREALSDPPSPPGAGSRLKDLFHLLRMVLRVGGESRKLARTVPAFQARVGAVLAPLAGADLLRESEDELLQRYRDLERDLLRHWQAPLVNDFFAMIYFGVLGRLIAKWLPRAPATLANDLLCGNGGIISTEPARHVMLLARRVAQDPELARGFAEEADAAALLTRLGRDAHCAEFLREFEAYVERFGDRCLEELKLETVTLREDPSFLVQMIRSYAANGAPDPERQRENEVGIRQTAEALVRSRLRGHKRSIFFWVMTQARLRVRDRENLRFERTRVFGMVRRIFLAVGERLAALGRFRSPRDVFYLTIDELLADGLDGKPKSEFRRLIELRRAEFAAFEQGPPPPDRFETWGEPDVVLGAAAPDMAAVPVVTSTGVAAGSELTGTGCCPGVVRERVRIVRDPRDAPETSGRILVAERTDPGWTLLFPVARGLLVQRGSLLSHSAIVAREMGLPCVVGIAGLLDTLEDGELVEMDGTTGRVVRLEAAGREA